MNKVLHVAKEWLYRASKDQNTSCGYIYNVCDECVALYFHVFTKMNMIMVA